MSLTRRNNLIGDVAFTLSAHPRMFFTMGEAPRGEWGSVASVIAVVIDAGDQLRILRARCTLRAPGSWLENSVRNALTFNPSTLAVNSLVDT
jgi:hypothetical protein